MQCRNCSGSDFEKLSIHEYKCRYCGTLMIVESLAPRPPEARNPKKDRAAAIAAVAAGIILGSIGFAVYLLLAVKGPESGPASVKPSTSLKPSPLAEYGGDRIEKVHPPNGDFVRVAALPDLVGNVHVVGIYRNTGRSVIRKPVVQVTLYSKEGRKVAVNSGYAIREVLLPGEETPVRVLLNHPPAWARYEIFHMADYPYPFTPMARPAMELRNCSLGRGRYTGYEIRGEIANSGRAPVKFVQLIGAVYDGSKNIIGVGADYASGQVIRPGDYSPFVIRVIPVRGTPESFTIDYEATEAR